MQIPGITMDGGYADYMVVKANAMAAMPEDLAADEAAPLLCAGITTYNALRRSGAVGGHRVAALGIGGLGHLGVQFSVKLGFETVAIARGRAKEELARRLVAHHYVDSTAGDPGVALSRLGGADVILSTVQRRRDGGSVQRPSPAGHAAGGRRLNGSDRRLSSDADRWLLHDHRTRLGHLPGLRGHAALQCAEQRAADDRDVAAGTGGTGIHQDALRQRPFPDGADDRRLRAAAV